MKVIVNILILCFTFSSIEICARNLPQEALQRRTFGNFYPKIRNSFQRLAGSSEENGHFKSYEELLPVAVKAFAAETRVGKDEIVVSSFHTSKHNGITHVYVQQNLNGVPVVNAFGNINILKNGRIHSIGNSFYKGQKPINDFLKPKYSASDAVRALANLIPIQTDFKFFELPAKVGSQLQETVLKEVDFALTEIVAELNYLQTDEGLKRVWKFNVDMPNNYYFTCVDSETNKVLFLIDFVSDAAYNVLPLGRNDPRSGPLILVQNPEDYNASPLGWHISGMLEFFNVTIGNNVIAQENLDGDFEYYNNYRPDGSNKLLQPEFNFPLNLSAHPTESIDASITQLFYMNNVMHDIFYRYGFDEVAGNFQENNFLHGGAGSDAVIANAMDGAGVNNADFRVMPDGANGRMRMYLFEREGEVVLPRDGVFDSAIVIHEYLHGISGRLTGGRSNVACLGSGESGGMGEGWGDIFGVIFQMNQTSTRDLNFEMGTYVSTGNVGMRNFPYSTSMTTNPSTYSYTVRSDYEDVHYKGEVWTAILYEVYWNLVDKHGFQADWSQTNSSENMLGGNVIFTQLVIDGMKFQPCNPTFIDARNAILMADEINNNGANSVELWKGFAKRGLGVNAMYPGIEDFQIPSGVSVNSASAVVVFIFMSYFVVNF